MNGKAQPHFYDFDSFRLDTRKRLLWRDGESVVLTARATDLLIALIERRGQVVEKDELLQLLWPDTVVEENNLTVNVSALRKALAAGPGERRYIVTVPGRGYRFVAEVAEASIEEAEETELVIEKRTAARIVIEEQPDGPVGELAATQHVALPQAALALQRPNRKSLAISALALTLLGAAAIYFWLARRPTAAESAATVKSMAVLPFKPLALDNRDEALELGIADTLITRLSTLRQVIVRPTSAVRRYSDLQQDPLAAGRELQVEAVLEGSIQRAGSQVRVTVRLLRTSDGAPLWAEKFDEQFTNLFAVEDAIAERMARTLALRLSGDEKTRLAKHPTEDTAAYQLYLQGRYSYDKRTEAGLKKAVEYFQQATERDPRYALAYAGLAEAYLQLPAYSFTTPSAETYLKAKAAAAQALQLDDTLAEGYVALAFLNDRHEWDWAAAERDYRHALELNPNYAAAHHRLGMHLLARGRFDEARAELQRAWQLDPLSPTIGMNLGMCFLFARQYEPAIAQLQKTIELEPRFPWSHEVLGWAYEWKRMDEAALAEYLKSRILADESVESIAAYKAAYQASGLRGYWQKRLALLKQQAAHSYVSPLDLARIAAHLGEQEQALAWLEQAYAERNVDMMTLKVEPFFDGLRAEPRFADLLRRVGLG